MKLNVLALILAAVVVCWQYSLGLCQDPTDILHGCYFDSVDRVLTDFITCSDGSGVCHESCGAEHTYCRSNDQMTIEVCRTLCRNRNLRYYNLEAGNQCHCGGALSNPFRLGNAASATSNCSVPCTGDASQACGGDFEMQVYEFQDPVPGADCFHPGFAPNAFVSENMVLAVGERVTFLCEPRYRILGHAELTCQAGGTWSPNALPVCNYTAVPEPVTIPVGELVREPTTTKLPQTETVEGTSPKVVTTTANNDTPAYPENSVYLTVIGVLFGLLAVVVIGVILYAVRTQMECPSENTRTTPKSTTTNEKSTAYENRITPRNSVSSGPVVSKVYAEVGLPSWAAGWSILWSDFLVYGYTLGRGDFGQVILGAVRVSGKLTKATIRMLKGQASPSNQEDFMGAFRTMTSIGCHPNVVSLLGACQYQDVLYVALEYPTKGDLRSYLRQARLRSESGEDGPSSEQLVKLAFDVAKGMKHLASSGVVHRDLAARNILLGDGLIAKVSNFGLSRGEDVYVRTLQKRVPIQWLAIESLIHQIYTTQSDVWSFGILLWEIASLGGTPYASIKTELLAEKLRDGYRMTRPVNCDNKIYSLMLRCWEEEPHSRPSFADLILILGKMTDKQTMHTYSTSEMDPAAHYENPIAGRLEIDSN